MSFASNFGMLLKISSPFVILTPFGYWGYNKRQKAIAHPVMQRAMLHLQKDQRVLDFCGENIKPGYWITVNEDPTENYVKFDFGLKGSSGQLGAIIIGDYLTHRELTILEKEREDYFQQRSEIKEKLAKVEGNSRKKDEAEELGERRKQLDANYIPIDFDAYSVEDKATLLREQAELEEKDRLWRISSLTAYVDDETKILLLPLPESKRTTKIKDTTYSFKTVGDLMNRKREIENLLMPSEEVVEVKRFEDKTKEEIDSDIHKKRQKQMNKMIQTRKYQFLFFTIVGVFYMLVYRRFLHPKSIMNSVLYHNALKQIKINSAVKAALGNNLHFMNCNGKTYPLLNNCKFDIVIFGNEAKGKINVSAEYSKDANQWQVSGMEMVT